MADPTSTTSNRYEWIGSSGGLWGSAANWKDSTAGTSPARFAPGASNPVTINEPTGASYEVVSGGGSAASLSLTGAVALNGQYTSDSLVLGVDPPPNVPPPNYNYPPNSKLSLGSGSALSTGGVSVKNSTITVSGPGAGLTAATAMTLGGLANYNRAGVYRETGNLSVTDGASLAAAALNVVSGSISVSGAGSRATLGGALTLGDPGSDGIAIVYNSSAGSLAVNAGASLTTQGVMSLLYGSSASVAGTGSKLTVGGLTGTGQVQIGEDATLALNGAAAAGTTIAFAGNGATLSIGNASTLPYSIAATLTGFVGGDDITLGTNITSATYSPTGTGIGTLNLFNGTQQVTSFALSGSYAGYDFLVRPTASGSTVTLLQNGDGSASPVSDTSDRYVWVGSSGGLWGSAPNWMDSTSSATPSLFVPGGSNPVTIMGPSGSTFETIASGGSAASLGLTGEVVLNGSYKVGGALTVGSSDVPSGGATAAFTAGSLVLAAAGTISTGSINVVDGTLSLANNSSVSSNGSIVVGAAGSGPQGTISVAAGATFSTSGSLLFGAGSGMRSEGSVNVGGAVSVNGGDLSVSGAGSRLVASGVMTAAGYVGVGAIQPRNAVSAAGGALIQLGGLVLSAPIDPNYSTSAPDLVVDAASTIEIGSAGGAAAGAITVDAGKAITVSDRAIFNNTLVDNGTVTVTTTPTYNGNGTLIQNGDISGNGVVQLGKDSRLELNGNAAATSTIAFLDTGAVLSIGPSFGTTLPPNSAPYSVNATITGFRAGDTILVAQPVTIATYSAGPGGRAGTLVLSNGSTTVQTLHLTGDFTGKSFLVTPTHSLHPAISLIDGPVGNPVLSSPTLTVAENAASTALGIAAPTDPNYATGQLAITATGLPTDGTVTLADGVTAVAAGQVLTSAQLTSLRFTPIPGLFNAKSTFAYTASDPAGNASTAAATLAIGLPPTPKAEFDAAYYLQNNPDVARAKVDPLKHFETFGWKEGRNPDAIFNTQFYLNQNPDVAAAKVNPLTHYKSFGWKEGRDPSANFNTAAYLRANPDVAKAQIDPLKHYIEYGSREGRMLFAAQPHGVGAQDPLVDNAYYFSKYSDVRVSGVNPFAHYDTVGWRQGRNPDALFDTNYYLQRNPDVKAAAIDPLLHYEQYGWKEGRDPSAQFSTSNYLAANADVKAAGLDPLIHYEQYGIREGRPIFHV